MLLSTLPGALATNTSSSIISAGIVITATDTTTDSTGYGRTCATYRTRNHSAQNTIETVFQFRMSGDQLKNAIVWNKDIMVTARTATVLTGSGACASISRIISSTCTCDKRQLHFI
ncbi:MAG: hypothetical protein KIB40_19115 [Pantoea sp.]|uniref:hypothetical protein n=1 Tax=Pantoea TaxID=53335 RepID=UPI001330588B|nr:MULTISPECIES: hypothetical protein [Pantoea]MBS6035226.1 hypothetical protein [Pantoea sp.]MDH2125343.1 hypothetical protein [Pantoea brenneri]